MSMLADRRDKKRYNLVPRGKALYEDKNNFGTRMLRKMGWSEGKGLGIKEDGNQEFIHVKYKNDSMGFGYEDRDDHWTQHGEHFNGLLKSLNANNDSENKEEGCEEEDIPERTKAGFGFESNNIKNGKSLKENLSGESLEEKSKKSRTRVHYKKFTRGKDLTRYSEKDLANIFGKKTLNNDEDKNEVTSNENENEKTTLTYGVIIKNSEKSLENYFNEKLKSFKLKREENEDVVEYDTTVNNDEDDCKDNVTRKKSKKLDEKNSNGIKKNETENIAYENEKIPKTKKRKKKSNTQFTDEKNEHSAEEEGSSNLHKQLNKKQKNNDNSKESRTVRNTSSNLLCNESKKEAIINVYDNENTKQISNVFKSQSDEIKHSNKEMKFKKKGETSNGNSEMTIENPIEVINVNKLNTQDINKKCSSEIENDIKQESKEKSYELCDSYYTNEFVLEKFRHVALDQFKGSNIKDIVGYGCSNELVIRIDSKPNSTKRILNMWVDIENNKYKYEIQEKKKRKKRKQQKIFTRI